MLLAARQSPTAHRQIVFPLAYFVYFRRGFHVAAVLGAGIIAGWLLRRPFWDYIGQMVWGPTTNFVLVAVPLFLLMGESCCGGLSDKLYRSLSLWLRPARRTAAHQFFACGVFSAISIERRHRRDHGFRGPAHFQTTATPQDGAGSLAAGGTLGNLIPRASPSSSTDSSPRRPSAPSTSPP